MNRPITQPASTTNSSNANLGSKATDDGTGSDGTGSDVGSSLVVPVAAAIGGLLLVGGMVAAVLYTRKGRADASNNTGKRAHKQRKHVADSSVANAVCSLTYQCMAWATLCC